MYVSTSMKTLIITNTGAGSNLKGLPSGLDRLQNLELRRSRNRQETIDLAAGACDKHYDVVVAAGGDGTVNAVVNGLAGKQGTALGILPLGTANDLARTFEIPLDVDQALKVLLESNIRALDVGRLETESGAMYFANIASGGNVQRVHDAITPEIKEQWGALSYLRGAIAPLTNLDGFPVELQFDGSSPEAYNIWNLMIANGRYSGGGLAVAPRANPEDGSLDVVALLDSTPLEALGMAKDFVIGDYLENERVVFRHAQEVVLRPRTPMTILADGEPIEAETYRFSILPGGLRAIVGPQYVATPEH